jgi:basic amino acid/polyamine antiporter, APA family
LTVFDAASNTSTGAAARGSLLRVLGVTFGVALGVGASIGAGFFRVPAIVAAQLHDPWWIAGIWVVVTGYVFVDANTTAELSATLPQEGGFYVFVTRSFGAFPGFIVGWTDWVINTGAIAFVAATFIDFLAQEWPTAGPLHAVLGASLIAACAVLHLSGIRVGSRTQIVLSACKVIGLLAVIIACITFATRNGVAGGPADAQLTPHIVPSLAALIACWPLIQETYAGAASAAYLAEENTNPGHSIPRAIFGSVVVVTIVYLSAVWTLQFVLGPDRLAHPVFPLADAARTVFGGRSGTLVTAVALVVLLGLLNANVMFTPRILFAIARGGLFASKAAEVSARGTPVTALLFTALAAMLLVITNRFDQLFTITALLALVTTLASNAALFVLRRREPHLHRPFRALGYPWVPAIAVCVPAGVIVGVCATDVRNSAIGIGLIALAYPAYRALGTLGRRTRQSG